MRLEDQNNEICKEKNKNLDKNKCAKTQKTTENKYFSLDMQKMQC